MGWYSKSHKGGESLTYFRRLNQLLLLAAALIPLILFVLNRAGLSGHAAEPSPAAPAGVRANSGAPALARLAVESGRLYPYSVIPGGARSEQELQNALAHDPIAAAHYADFDVAHTRVVRVPQNELMYVSYRIGEHIYWTSKKLVIPGGESLLTDGEHLARTRCGNRLSKTPEVPVSSKQPANAVLNGPPLAEEPPAEVLSESAAQRAVAPPEIADADPVGGSLFIPPFIPIWGGSGTPGLYPPNGPPPPPPITPTPEPSSLVLLSAGLFGVWSMRRKLTR
jgi:PEP-CTERM motif